jgi:hypothetical protein
MTGCGNLQPADSGQVRCEPGVPGRAPAAGEPGCEHFWVADVRNLTGAHILAELGLERGEVDVVVGGPPCQGFSKANKNRSVMDPRNSLARRALGPLASRERVAQLLGADADSLDAQLLLRAEAGSEAKTTTGLRLDQAAVLYQAFTDGRLATTVTGPAGSGKTYTLVAAGLAAKKAGTREVWGVTCAQGARNVLADAAHQAGLSMRAYNSAKLFDGLDAKGAHQLHIAPGSLIIIDEASMMPVDHLARLIGLADDLDCKVLVAGDQEQLAAVEGGGGMRLLARENGYVQLAEPVRFENEWERSASLRLRAGDASVLREYDDHGRIRGGDCASWQVHRRTAAGMGHPGARRSPAGPSPAG